MASQSKPWYLPGGVKPGARREVAQEFFSNVLELGELAEKKYMEECNAGTRKFNQKEHDELVENIAIVRAELNKVQ